MSEGWQSLIVKEFSRLTAGGTPSTSKMEYWSNGTIPWLSSGEVHKKRIRYVDGYITEDGLKNSAAKLIPIKTLLVALAGQGKTRGTVAITEIETTTNQSIAGIIADKEICHPDYLFFNLDSRYDELRSISGGSGRAGLNLEILGNIDVSLPPLPEQKKIASILTSVDEVIENTQKQIDKLQDLKKATMNELLTKGIGHTEFKDSELGRIPKSWEVKRLDEINFKIVVGYVGNVNDFYCDASEGVPFYRTQNIRPDRFVNKTNVSVTKDFHAKNNKSRIENGDVLIARVGANLGMVCEVKGVLGEANAANVIIINRREDYSSEFLSLFLNSEKGKGSILVDAMGGAQGVFNTTIAKSLLVPVTTNKEMSEIARVIASIQGSMAKQQNKLVQTQSLKKSLMQDLLTGKVRVTVN